MGTEGSGLSTYGVDVLLIVLFGVLFHEVRLQQLFTESAVVVIVVVSAVIVC